jgi:serine/threonine-protein kinase
VSVLEKGSVVCGSFTVERLVRSDLSGECYEVRSSKGELCHAHLLWLKLRERGLERWKHETAQVNRLELPCVPKTLGGGTSISNRALIVTELVTGESLEELRKAWGGRLPGQVAMRFFLEILDALETAHKKGIVHGALRLESVLIDPDRDGERLCIADFAFARFMEESYRRRSVVDARGATTSTLAPEQLAGNHLADARTDIYSAAAVAFRLLGGDLALLVGDGTKPPPDEVRKKAVLDVVTADDLPPAVAEALFTALAPTRQDRPASAWLLAERLREALGLAVAKTPSVSPADDEPRSITTLSELENVMLEEARRSMGLDGPEMRALAASLMAPEPSAPASSAAASSASQAVAAAPSAPSEANVDDPSKPSLSVLVSVPTEVAAPYTDAKKVAPRANPPVLRKIAPKSPPAGTPAQAASATTTGSGSDAVDDSVVLAPGRSLSKVTVGASGELQWLKGTLRMKRGPGGEIAVANEPSPAPPEADDAPPASGATSKPKVRAAPSSSAVPESDDTGRYVLDRPMASGGMATVYLGRMFGGAGFSRAVAIKRLHATLAADPRFTRMMIDEARMASRISHPNVVPVLDVVTSGESVMLVFEYVLGVTLSQLTRAKASRAPLPPNIAAAVVVSALRGLEAAHTATDELGRPMGLVHRDVSPQNIMVASDGMVRVIDFGIARALGRAEVTTGTELRGKASYMAPERFRGQKSDHRVDLWSMGVLMWELCMGAKLFDADDPIEVALMVCTGTIPQTGYDPIDRVLERALSRDLATRYASADEMARAIEASMPVADQRTVAHHVRTSCDELLQLQREALVALEARFPDDPGRPIAPLGKIPTPSAMAPVELDYSGKPPRSAVAVATPRPLAPLPFPARPHLPAPASSSSLAVPAAPSSSGRPAVAQAASPRMAASPTPAHAPSSGSPSAPVRGRDVLPAPLSVAEEAQLALASGSRALASPDGYPPKVVVAALLLATVFFVAAAAVWLTTSS